MSAEADQDQPAPAATEGADAALRAEFDELDLNHNGVIDEAEVHTLAAIAAATLYSQSAPRRRCGADGHHAQELVAQGSTGQPVAPLAIGLAGRGGASLWQLREPPASEAPSPGAAGTGVPAVPPGPGWQPGQNEDSRSGQLATNMAKKPYKQANHNNNTDVTPNKLAK